MARMRAPWTLVVSSASALFGVACDASVDRFTASAHSVCPGQPVQIAWRVTGSATVTSKPPLAALPDGPVDEQGHVTVAPTTTTNIELSVTRRLGRPTASTQELAVRGASSAPEPLAVSLADPSAGCGDGKVWATVHARRFSRTLAAAAVSSHAGDGRTYDVTHAGVTATVSPGVTARQFAGMAILGDWVLTSPLAAGEACGTPTLPRSLVVDVFTQCVPEESR